ncbi:hypothetical protein AVHY2522_10945 [Acidovorax sp. SUPP2522]|uniref:hypothetical protein n=1 Tax=unclassified Acidovorax TaxID=2684926 RepID=UPI00234A1F31|nr:MULTISPECIES: hypothetical protein [unclassified Acidovorax]WCM99394.1 hypothetical protein M5C96_08260 [Acidovorax sp. GBBC 1281]GKT16236.1 hypothetical protein AVHY2522_10945 [Acidovorax sp. SUPP2522]
MLKLYTVPEALAELTTSTGRPWTESMLFDTALRLNLTLRAAPPRSTTVSRWRFVIGEGLVTKARGLPWTLAMLYPQNIAEVWQTGETEVMHSAQQPMEEGDLLWFETAVVVQRQDVRVPAVAVEAMQQCFGKEPAATPARSEQKMGQRERNAYLRLVGAMLELLKSPRPGRDDDTSIIRELVDNYGDTDGISESSLARKFAEAKRLLQR